MWAPPTPGLWNKAGTFSDKMWRPGFSFLQMLGKPVSIKDNHLVQHLVPVPATLCPFFDHISAGKVEHFFQCSVAGKYTFRLCYLPVLPVQPFYDIGGTITKSA